VVRLDSQQLWRNFWSSSLCKDWWIFLFKEVSSLGPIIRYGLRLIDFFYLRSGKNITLRWHNEDCLEFYRIIFHCCWIVGRKEKGTSTLNLKICGSNLMVL
jgi:hypothetical protein